jgi:putative transposase
MPRRVYYEIYFHITWHTKHSLPIIKPDIESKLYSFLKHKILETPKTICHAIGGIEDHIHIAVTLPPTVLASEWIGKLKGSSSHNINQLTGRKTLEWQHGYGIVSFGEKDLPWVVNYILNQKEHHRTGKTHDRLERTEDDDG